MAARIKKSGPLQRHFIAEWRLAGGLSKADLARAIGSSKPTISAIEDLQVPYSQHTLELIAGALQIHPAWLILAPPDQLSDVIIRTLAANRRAPRFPERTGRQKR